MKNTSPSGGLQALRRLIAGPDYPPTGGRRPRWWPRWWPRWRMTFVQAGLLLLIGLTVAAVQYLQDERNLPGLPAILLAIGSTLPIAIALRRPLLAWRICYPLLYLGVVDFSPREAWPWHPMQVIGTLFVFGVLAVRADTGVATWAALLTLIPVFLFAETPANGYGVIVLFAVVLLLGDQIRRRRQSQRALVEQSERSELEQARRAVLEERTRIAREMHDVVAHHMSMIAVQAETAPYRLGSLPEPARAEFTAIAGSARQALADMRRLLGVLRSESASPETAPQPGLADIAELVGAARRAGMVVTLDESPLPAEQAGPPEAVGLAAYRIVQEALANAARHAPGAAVRVVIRPDQKMISVRVDNDDTGVPTGTPTRGAGHGLTGMRERARLLGGTFTAAPAGGGFTIEAELPYDGKDGDR
ncbi:sensor histidine kinase [Micromonospora sp. NPDC003197]